MDFDFYVGGIEDGIMAALEPVMKAGPLKVASFDYYSGELDDIENLKKAIASKGRRFPLVMVSYGGGTDKRSPATAAVLGEPLHYRHDCIFGVVCIDSNPQGENARRRGKAYGMLAAVRSTLTGLRLKKRLGNDDITLTHGVLEPEGNDYVMKLPDLTAYVVIFRTWFNWSSPDRSTAGDSISELVLDLDSLNAESESPDNVPGVTFKGD